jgi:nucleoside-diphosphate-sugar epimerase
MTTPPRSVLVLGISGSIGLAVAEALGRRGTAVHALARDPDGARAVLAGRGRAGLPVAWHRGDALDRDAVVRAAGGMDLIMHGVNPPKLRRWREEAVPMLANALAAAEASGARVLFPGNAYVFAPASGPAVDEATPHRPETRKGAVRRDMERMLLDAAARGVRSLTVRAGDYFGPGVAGSWFHQMIATCGGEVRAVRDLCSPGVGHAWAYVPDLAETFARLIEREEALDTHAVFHFGGHWTDPGSTMAEAIRDALRPRRVPIRPFPWPLMRLAAPFVPMVREALEMRWPWRHPLRLDGRKLEALIGPEPHTPLDEAVRATLGIATPRLLAARHDLARTAA